MFGPFAEFDRSFAALDELRRRMDRIWEDFDTGYDAQTAASAVWPRANLVDTGAELVIYAEVPGLGDKDLQITLTHDTLTLRGERKATVPEGYSVHRQERGNLTFQRSFGLPTRVDVDKVSALVKHGVLTITLPKAAEVRPRQITVKAS